MDNEQAISFKRNTCLHSKIRGCVSLNEKWVQELRDDGVTVCRVEKVKGARNPADLLTKCLVNREFNYKCGICKGVE